MTVRYYGKIPDLQDPISFVRDHTLCLHTIIFQNIHRSSVQIQVDHTLLLIREKEQLQIRLFIFRHLTDLNRFFLHKMQSISPDK